MLPDRIQASCEGGFILLSSLWALSLLSILAASLTLQSSQRLILAERERLHLEGKADFLSGFHLASEAILTDSKPHVDSFNDGWYGEITLPDKWQARIRVYAGDEESKINLNTAPESFLKAFFELIEEEAGPLSQEPAHWIRQIMKRRMKEKILSLEELYLFEDWDAKDFEKIRPYVTVYPAHPYLNINTAHAIVVKALVASLPGDSRAKEDLLRAIFKQREKANDREEFYGFNSEELDPNSFLQKLKLSRTIAMLHLVNHLLPYLSTDSRTFFLEMTSAGKDTAQVMMKEGERLGGLEIIHWHEA